MTLFLGDCLEQLKGHKDSSIDAVVTDPPYGLAFMGKKWDYDVPSVELWREVFRVLKPGGHVLSFGGTRTYHRMVVNIEDAGFEIRDQVMWIYGSGFPKSLNVGKKHPEWQGWGTALKPANEPIVLARKPLEKGLTVAENVLKWGVGALNIDGTRIGYASEADKKNDTDALERFNSTSGKSGTFIASTSIAPNLSGTAQGRWPANVLFDEDAAKMLDVEAFKDCGGEIGTGPSRFFYVAKTSKRERNAGLEGMPLKAQGAYGEFAGDGRGRQTEHQPTANYHPTVKPIKLMEYLCKLITPPGGTILDPFMGSGSTGCAAVKLGFRFIGIEREPEYLEIAKRRIECSGVKP